MLVSFNDCILDKIDKIFSSSISDDIRNKMINNMTKFIKSDYQKSIIENLDIKILVKDTTLINSVKEQSDRYLFTINNSRLFTQ